MAYYIAVLTQALTAAALVAALWTAATAAPGRAAGGAIAWAAGLGLAAGGLAALSAAKLPGAATAIAAAVHAAAVAAALLGLVVLGLAALRPAWRRLADFGLLLVAVLAAQGVFEAWRLSADHSLTATDVINTELIVNGAAIAIGAVLLAALAALMAGVARLLDRRVTAAAVALVLVLLLIGGAEKLVLGLLRLDLVAVTAGRVSFVARLSILGPWLAYGQLAIALVLVALASLTARRPAEAPGASPVARRRVRARILGERRWRRGLTATAALLFAIMLYQDVWASRPPALSPAAPVAADEAGTIRIAVDRVKDGNLHRFAYVASDGHRVRFFLVNRYDEAHVNIGVVYDACMICGDEGYVQNGREIICIACNVRMFRPSIGKPGGCNPIPLPHEVREDTIVIAAAELEKGVRYFSEVVEIEVRDPVSGARLVNLKAPHQYDYGGRTYFFENRSTYERFRADPARYAGGREG